MANEPAIFVDTGAWYATLVQQDPDHGSAMEFVRSNRRPLVTSDYVVDELLTLLRVRGQRQRAEAFLDAMSDGKLAQVDPVLPSDFRTAIAIYRQWSDKDWSFTDCTSFALMQRQQISLAFAFDVHFRQFGNVTVLPAVPD